MPIDLSALTRSELAADAGHPRGVITGHAIKCEPGTHTLQEFTTA